MLLAYHKTHKQSKALESELLEWDVPVPGQVTMS
jgi:hypothetical protein